MLSWPPKKPRGKEADGFDSKTTMYLYHKELHTTTLENIIQTSTNSLENEKRSNIVQTKKEHEVFKEIAQGIGVTISQQQFRTGHQIRERSTEMVDHDPKTTDMFQNGKVLNIAQTKKEDNHGM